MQATVPNVQLASWGRRALATLIDAIVIGIPIYLVLLGTFWFHHTTTIDFADGRSYESAGSYFPVGIALCVLIYFLYWSLTDGGQRGQSLGKRAMKIATRDARDESSIGYWRAFLRRLVFIGLWAVFLIPGLVNCLSPLWSSTSQAWHDQVVSSVVVNV